MLNKHLMAAAMLVACSACKRGDVEVHEPVVERYRPAWATNIPAYIAGIRACMALREAPAYVAHVEPLVVGATGVTTIDAYGQLENCAWADGKVVRREPVDATTGDLEGLPLFAVGPAQPVVGVGSVLEEVLEDEHVIGWLCWPHASGAAPEHASGGERGTP